MTYSDVQLLIDNDIIDMVWKSCEGIPVDEETLALDSIRKVGIGKDHLSLKITRDHINIQSLPMLMNRRTRGDWEKAGAKELAKVAREKVQEILKTHDPKPIDRDILAEMEAFVKAKDKEYGHKVA